MLISMNELRLSQFHSVWVLHPIHVGHDLIMPTLGSGNQIREMHWLFWIVLMFIFVLGV